MIWFALTLILSAAQAQDIVQEDEIESAKIAVMDLINARRVSLGLRPVERDLVIEAVMQNYNDAMASGQRRFSHDGFAGRCAQIREELAGGNLCGEILAWGHRTPEDVHKGWMSSPGHNRAMIEPRYNRAGFAYTKNVKGRQYWSVLFLER